MPGSSGIRGGGFESGREIRLIFNGGNGKGLSDLGLGIEALAVKGGVILKGVRARRANEGLLLEANLAQCIEQPEGFACFKLCEQTKRLEPFRISHGAWANLQS
jgi:hypothetical protein